jgi:hypothetical protein
LAGLNLDNFGVYQDEENGEVLLVDPGHPNRFWIVLNNEWRIAENLPYIAEEDINLINLDVYTDSVTKRKYVIDDKAGQKYYLIPKFRENIRNYVTAANVPLKVENKKKVDFVVPGQKTPPRAKSDDSKAKIGAKEAINELSKEPSTFGLRKTAANSPERFKRM